MKYINTKEWEKLITDVMSYQFKDYSKKPVRKHLHGRHCISRGTTDCPVADNKSNTDYLVFDKNARKRYLRNILCELKSEICGSQDLFDVGFEIENTDDGFECRFVVSPKNDTDIEGSFMTDKHYRIRDFVADVLDYLVSKDVEINWTTNRNSLTTKFTLSSF